MCICACMYALYDVCIYLYLGKVTKATEHTMVAHCFSQPLPRTTNKRTYTYRRLEREQEYYSCTSLNIRLFWKLSAIVRYIRILLLLLLLLLLVVTSSMNWIYCLQKYWIPMLYLILFQFLSLSPSLSLCIYEYMHVRWSEQWKRHKNELSWCCTKVFASFTLFKQGSSTCGYRNLLLPFWVKTYKRFDIG